LFLRFGILIVMLSLTAHPAAALAQTGGCQITLGFAELRDLVGPEIVGECIEDQAATPMGTQQRTANGLLIWRESDNATLFTDGTTTWISGPFGLQTRPSDQRFDWEAIAPPAAPVTPPAAAAPVVG
jgi:hypothetical protein